MKGLLTAYASNTITLAPVKKIRILCEVLKALPLPEDVETKIDDIYTVAVALDGCSSQDSPICVPWPFAQTEENFERYIAPWLKRFPDFSYINELDKQHKLQRVLYKVVEVDGKAVTTPNEPWEQFFVITTKLDLSVAALEELKAQFAKWAMAPVMREIAQRLERGLAQDLDLEKPTKE